VKSTVTVPKKRLGQNFLISRYYARKIASAVESTDDSKVIEIGPGKGALSIFLKERFPRFHLIEMDKDIIPSLKEKIGRGKWTLHVSDVLRFDFETLGSPLHIVGNLPYNIAALIIKKTLFYSPNVASVTYMVQREVAERIVADPHTKQNGFLSIFCQFFGSPKILFHVPPGAFVPKPKVESSVFQLNIDSHVTDRLPGRQWESFFTFVSNGFSTRRKMLANSLSLKTGIDKEVIGDTIFQTGFDKKVRAEDLNVHEWLRLYSQLREKLT
jgi:16S rRNA (adenine1518-N6/adenine1519-N6)-dimethyltransferase